MSDDVSNTGCVVRQVREGAALETLNKIQKHCGCDCVIAGYDGWSLQLLSGTSPEYALPLAEFVGVEYLESAFVFSYPTFRLAHMTECDLVSRRTPLDENCLVFAIDAETMASMDRCTFYVVAETVRLSAQAV